MPDLHIAKDFRLPASSVSDVIAIIGRRGQIGQMTKYLLVKVFVTMLAIVITVPAWSAPRPPTLSYSQKHALVEAWRAGYHVGLPLTFAAIIYVESKACADSHKSSKGAVGCAQVLPATANGIAGAAIPEWQLSSVAFTEENMGIGAHYLRECMDKFGWPAGIGCYDYGLHTKLTRAELTHLRYTRAVLAAMKWLRNLPQSEE